VLRDLLRDLLHLLRGAYLLYSITVLISCNLGYFPDLLRILVDFLVVQRIHSKPAEHSLSQEVYASFVLMSIAHASAIKRRFRLDFIATLVTVLV